MKSVKAKLQEKGKDADVITAFEKGAQAYVKEKLLPNFKDFEFYTGESMDPDGMYVQLSTRSVLHLFIVTHHYLGSSSSTTVRTAPPPISLSGSTVWMR
jgi:hypothetical protein